MAQATSSSTVAPPSSFDDRGGEVVHVELPARPLGHPPVALAEPSVAELGIGRPRHGARPEVVEQEERVVQHVHADVQQSAAARDLLAGEPAPDPRYPRTAPPERLAVVGASDPARLHELPGALHLRREALVHAQHEVGVRRARGGGRLLGVFPAQRQRLLLQHVLAGLQRQGRQRRVQVIGHGDVDRVDLVDGQQPLRFLHHLRDGVVAQRELRGPFRVGLRHGDDLGFGVLGEVAAASQGDASCPDDSYANHAGEGNGDARAPLPRAACSLDTAYRLGRDFLPAAPESLLRRTR